MAQENKICQICGEKGHSKFYCKTRTYKPIPKVSDKKKNNPTPKKIYKPINKVGKKAIQWKVTSKEWKQQNPSDKDGFWYCLIGGGRLSDKSSDNAYRLNLCHDKSRARHPSLSNELSNIFPGCPRHNSEQGSRDLDEYLASDHKISCGNF
jgi:hypothetical protein